MTTTAEMIQRELAPLVPAPRVPHASEDDRISIQSFGPGNTLQELFVAANAIEKLGHVAEIRFILSRKEPAEIELFVKDVPAMISTLRASLEVGRRS